MAVRRCFVVEVMGRHCGYLTLMSGMAGGARHRFPERRGARFGGGGLYRPGRRQGNHLPTEAATGHDRSTQPVATRTIVAGAASGSPEPGAAGGGKTGCGAMFGCCRWFGSRDRTSVQFSNNLPPAILILAISPVLDYGGAGSKGGEGSSRTGTTRPGSKLWSMNVIKASQFSKHR